MPGERERAAASLAENEGPLHLFIEHAPAALAMFDREMRYVAASNRWKRDYHLEGEIIGRSHYELFPEIPERWKEVHRRGLAGEVLRAEEDAFPREDGTTQWIKWEVRPWHQCNGDIGGILIAAEEITAQVLAKKALQESEARYRTLFEFIDEGFCVIEVIFDQQQRPVDYRFIEANPAFEKQTGLHNAVGQRVRKLVPQHEQHWFDIYGRVALSGEAIRFENQAAGLDRWFDVYAFPLRESQRVGIVFNDITQRKRSEQQLRESEERFRQLAENIPQLAWMTDANGWIFWYNKRWFEYTGTTLEEMLGWGWQKVHHPEYIERVTQKWKNALETGEPWQDTFPLRGKDGRFRWFLSRAFPIHDPTGNITRWFGTNTDVTDLREAQTALTEREAVLRTVTNEARVGLVMVDKERRYLFANQTYAEILGLPDANIVGKRVPDVLSHVYEQIEPRLDAAFKGERVTYELQIPVHSKTGDERFYEVVYEPRIENRTEPYVVVVIVDITERKKAQETLEHTVAERTAALEESNAQMEAFTYTIAHDLRAPLRAQQGFATALLEEYGKVLGETGRDYAQHIIDSAVRLNDLVNDLLAFSRISRTEMKLEKIGLHKMVLSICEEMAFQIRETNAKVQVEAFSFQVYGHDVTLRTTITNLLSNALKFTRPGQPPEVSVRAEERGQFVRLWIEDKGIGISPEYHHQIFGVFHRLHKIGEYPGTGVGLAIVQKGVERMGGHAGVESEEGAGSRFWIELEKAY